MTPVRPELVFVAGCQAGQRSVLMSNIAVAGRSQAADVQLREEYVSRQQFRLTYTTDGWIVESLSDNPIRINGKKYKRGKRIIVETGDVVGVGVETEILFVAQGDDAEEAFAAYRAAHGVAKPAAPAEAAEAAQAPAIPEEEGEQVELPPPVPVGDVGEQPEEAPEAELEAEEGEEGTEEAIQRKAKLKKYGIMFGVYMGLLIVAGIILSFVFGDKIAEVAPLRRLKERDIDTALTAELKPKGRDQRAAAEALRNAKAMYQDADVKLGNLYKSIKYFKLHLAYKRGPIDTVEDAKDYEKAKRQLVEQVQRKYRSALIFEKNRQWQQAKLLFEELLRMVPAKSEPEPEERNLLFDNVTEHVVFVRKKMREAKGKSASPF